MAKIYKDFDEFFKSKKDSMIVRLFGKEYEIPASITAKIALNLGKMAKEDPDRSMGAEEVMEILQLIYTEEVIEEWLDGGITMEELSEVLGWTIQQYGQAKVSVPEKKTRVQAKPKK